jgi:hypothetical protein
MRRQPGDGRRVSRDRDWQRGVGLTVLVSGLWLATADVHAQSLGELAVREQARRAAIASRSRVYANDPRMDPDAAATPAPPAFAVVPLESRSTVETAELTLAPIVSELPMVVAKEPAVVSLRLAVAPEPPAVASGFPAVLREASSPTTQTPASVTHLDVSSGQTAPSTPLAGWSAFQIKKTKAELTETARLQDGPELPARTGPNDVKLPPQHDALRVATGIGYLQGADFGGDVTASGKINGMQTDMTGFFTAGPMGFQSRSARVSIFAPDGKWRGEGGDLYSDLRGLARGARVSWSIGQKWMPSLGVYVHGSNPASTGPTVLSYRDRFQLLPHVRVGGEVTSDGATFVQTQYTPPRLDLTAFYRSTRGPIGGHDKGVSGGLALGRGVALSGAIRVSDAASDSSQWQLASIRLPLVRQASVTLERSWWTGSADEGGTNALTLQVPLGPVRLMQRVQWGRTDYRHRAVPFGFDRQQSNSTASYTPGSWGNLNYQQSTQWFDDGTVQEWDEVSSMLKIGRRTTAQFVAAFPDIGNPQRFRARVTRELSPTLQLEGQYGRLSAFQLTRASEGEQSRVMVTVRKTWQIESPARGGDVRGRALDQAGSPVAGALVRLGPYSAITDAAGGYQFTRVPDGQFDLALDKEKLPAAYALDEKPRPMIVARTSRDQVDLQVIPLNAIRGRVYLDRNHNGSWDEGEGILNAVVSVNGSVTATAADGSYAFYNQPPGHFTVRLDVQRLPKGLAPASPADLDVELTSDYPLIGVDFTVERKDMPVIMREIPR